MSKKPNYSAGANRSARINVRPAKSDIRRDKEDLDRLGRYLGLSDADFDGSRITFAKRKTSKKPM